MASSGDDSDDGITAADAVLEYVCPALGVLAANLMFVAPLKDLQSAVSIGLGLGDLNPTPWAFMLGNCLGWSAYGVLKNNWFIFWANYPGFLVACWLNLGAVKLLYSSHHREETRKSFVTFLSSRQDLNGGGEDGDLQRRSFFREEGIHQRPEQGKDENGVDVHRNSGGESVACGFGDDDDRGGNATASSNDGAKNDGASSQVQDWAKIVWEVTSQTTPARTPHERLIVGIILLWTLVLSGIGFGSHYLDGDSGTGSSGDDNETIGQIVVGWVVNFNLVFFYGAPLSKIRDVLKTKRSDMLHVPTMATNTANSIFWTAYALAVGLPFVYVPNGLGVGLGVIQFALWIVFPNKNKKKWRRRRERERDPSVNETSGDSNDTAD